MKLRKATSNPEPPSDMFKELEFIYGTYSRSGSLDQFKKQFPDSVLNVIFERLQKTIGWSVDEILVMLYEVEDAGIDLVKRKEN